MARRGELAATVFLALLLSSSLLVFGAPGARAETTACIDSPPAPVLQDSGWRNFSSTYSTFSTWYLESGVLLWGQTFIIYVREQINNTMQAIFRGASNDGVHWNMYPSPVLTVGANGSWDSSVVFSPDVIWNGTGFLMYYVGDGSGFRQIGVAFSTDGIHWTKSAHNPVIVHGPGVYDARFVRWPSVIYDNGVYKMWYTGETDVNATTPFLNTVEYATSTDGVHWTKYPGNPVFSGYTDSSGYTSAMGPSVLKVNGTYLMAFGDFGNSIIGLATSTDGIHWSFSQLTGLLLTTSGWHNGTVTHPALLLYGHTLLLWYTGEQSTNATSPFAGGVGFATCGVLVAPVQATTTATTSATSTLVVTHPLTSTLISTSTVRSTVATTVTENPSAPVYQVATSFVVGFSVALAAAILLIVLRIRGRR